MSSRPVCLGLREKALSPVPTTLRLGEVSLDAAWSPARPLPCCCSNRRSILGEAAGGALSCLGGSARGGECRGALRRSCESSLRSLRSNCFHSVGREPTRTTEDMSTCLGFLPPGNNHPLERQKQTFSESSCTELLVSRSFLWGDQLMPLLLFLENSPPMGRPQAFSAAHVPVNSFSPVVEETLTFFTEYLQELSC